MKSIVFSLIVILGSSATMAQTKTHNLVCVAPDVRVTISYSYNNDGLEASGNYLGTTLKLISSPGSLPVLEGWVGDTDNNTTYQITLLDNNTSAVLVTQNDVDRVGTNHSTVELNCQ
ncbi:MAG TPA: hypothetical protein VF412_08320 [Bdellovibrio sp.]|uniref:hypothetical protein n=1 Tax=Bdellovibrio sp. TaxID=28201 RepID=UPI002F1074A6